MFDTAMNSNSLILGLFLSVYFEHFPFTQWGNNWAFVAKYLPGFIKVPQYWSILATKAQLSCKIDVMIPFTCLILHISLLSMPLSSSQVTLTWPEIHENLAISIWKHALFNELGRKLSRWPRHKTIVDGQKSLYIAWKANF